MRAHPVVAACASLLISGGEWLSAAQTWTEARTRNFTVTGDGTEAQVRALAVGLEQFRRVVGSLLLSPIVKVKPLTVIAARDEATVRQLLPEYWERRGGVHPGGLFADRLDDSWAIAQTDARDPTGVLFHEYVHSLAHQSIETLPLWLDEGLAQVFGGARVDAESVSIGEISSGQLSYLRRTEPLPVARLVEIDRGSTDYDDRDRAGAFYGGALLLTHYLILGDGGKNRPALNSYLRALGGGASHHDALTQAFGSAEALDRRLAEYLTRNQRPAYRIPSTARDEPVSLRRLRPAEAATFLAQFMLAMGQRAAASAQLDAALRAEPGLGPATLVRGLLLRQEGHGDEATAALAEARRSAPDDAMAQYQFGKLATGAAGLASQREEALRAAIRLAPDFVPAKDALAKLLVTEKRSLDEALALAKEAVRRFPGSIEYRLTLLDAEAAAGTGQDTAKAELELSQLVRTNVTALAALAGHYETAGQLQKAEDTLWLAREQNFHSVACASLLASFLSRTGRGAVADAVLRTALSAEPESPMLMNSLAYVDAERGVNLPEALRLADEALKIAPTSAEIQDTKAWVLFQMGRYGDAEQLIRKALEAGETPTVLEHLAEILERQHRPNEARATWKRLLADPDLDQKKRNEIEGKLKGSGAGPAAKP